MPRWALMVAALLASCERAPREAKQPAVAPDLSAEAVPTTPDAAAPPSASPTLKPPDPLRLNFTFAAGRSEASDQLTKAVRIWFYKLPDLAKVDIIKGRLFYVISAPRGLPTGPAERALFKRRAASVARELKATGDQHKDSFPDPDGQFSALTFGPDTADTIELHASQTKP